MVAARSICSRWLPRLNAPTMEMTILAMVIANSPNQDTAAPAIPYMNSALNIDLIMFHRSRHKR